jgi:predicted ATPase
MRLFAQNFKSLQDINLPLDPGLSVLVGPNAAGKSSLLSLGSILEVAASPDGIAAGIERWSGFRDLKRLNAAQEDRIVIGFEDEHLRWKFFPVSVAGGLAPYPAERLIVEGETIYDIEGGVTTFQWGSELVQRDSRSVLRQLFDRDEASRKLVERVVSKARGYRHYADYVVRQLRERGSPVSGHKQLHSNGFNAFSVLRNWRDKNQTFSRWEFVITGLKECFPWFETIDFEGTNSVIEAQIILRGHAKQPISSTAVANGWFVALLHLCAVASADDGQTVAIDEFEHALHPFAINELFDFIANYLRGRSISVLLTSQSPTVLDWFEKDPEHVFVLTGDGTSPRRLTDLHDREWLTHFRLGQLFQSEGLKGA